MVVDAAGIVFDLGADVTGKGVEVQQDFFQRPAMKLGKRTEQVVEVVDVGSQMLVVMKAHRCSVNVGRQPVVRIGQGHQ